MEVVVGRHLCQGVDRMSGDAGALPTCEVKILMTFDRTVFQVRILGSRNWSVFMERPNTGRHEKAPVRCPCSRLAALDDAPWTHNHCQNTNADKLAFLPHRYSSEY